MRPYSKYLKSFALGAQSGMEYRADFLLGMVSAVWPIFIQFFLWKSIYAGSGQQSLFGYTYPQMIAYTIIANVVQRLTRTGFEYEMNEDIKMGGLDKFLVRPVGYFQYRMATFVGTKFFQLAVMFVVMAVAVGVIDAVYGGVILPLNMLFFLISLVLAFALNFTIFFCVGMLAFRLSEIGFLYEAVRIVFIAFSGGIFPLEVFGSTAVTVLGFLPFKYTVNFPVDVLTGRVTGLGLPLGFLIQIAWIAGMSLIALRLWSAGLKKYIAAGG